MTHRLDARAQRCDVLVPRGYPKTIRYRFWSTIVLDANGHVDTGASTAQSLTGWTAWAFQIRTAGRPPIPITPDATQQASSKISVTIPTALHGFLAPHGPTYRFAGTNPTNVPIPILAGHLVIDDDPAGTGASPADTWNVDLHVGTDTIEIVQLAASGGGGGGGGGAVDSVNGQTGVVVLTAADIGFTPTGTIAATTVAGALAELATDYAAADSAEAAARANADAAEVIARNNAISAAIAALVNSAPGALDTLNELAVALGNDPNFATTITNLVAGKQPLDSDLTAIAALATTAFGRDFLTLADAAAARTKLALGTAAQSNTSAFEPAGAAAAAQAAAIAASQPVDSDLTAIAALATTTFGRNLLTVNDATALAALLAATFVLTSDGRLNRIGSFRFSGHSQLVYGGAGGTEQGRRTENAIGAFASMLSMSPKEIRSLARSGGQLTSDAPAPYTGWAQLLKNTRPPANSRGGMVGTTVVPSAPYTVLPGGEFQLFGINDVLVSSVAWDASRGPYRAYSHALNSYIAARLAGGTFDHIHSAFTFTGTWTSRATPITHRWTTTNGDSFTIPIPIDFDGSEFAVTVLGLPDAYGLLTLPMDATQQTMTPQSLSQWTTGMVAVCGTEQVKVTGALAARSTSADGVTNGTTTVTSATGAFNAATDVGRSISGTNIPAGAYITAVASSTSITISANATGSGSTSTLTIGAAVSITRAFNGTTGAAHGVLATVATAETALVTWDSPDSGWSTTPTGTTTVSAQGCLATAATGYVAITKRFACAPADRGKRIRGTVSGIIASSDQGLGVIAGHVIARDKIPFGIATAPEYNYGSVWAANTAARIATLNGLITSAVTAWGAPVHTIDLDTDFKTWGAVLTAAIATAPAAGTQETWAVTPGANMPTAGGFELRFDTEDIYVIAGTTSLTVIRGVNGTTPATHTNGTRGHYRNFYAADNVHFASRGGQRVAQLTRDALFAQTLTAAQTVAANGYARLEPLPIRTGYIHTRGRRGRLLTTDQRTYARRLVLEQGLRLVAIGTEVLTAGSAGSVLNFGIWGDNLAGLPDHVILDARADATLYGGSIPAGTATGWVEYTLGGSGLYLPAGIYHVGPIPQGAPTTSPTLRSLIGTDDDLQTAGTANPAGDEPGAGNLYQYGAATMAGTATTSIAHGLPFTPDPAMVSWNWTQSPTNNTRIVVTTDATNINFTPGATVGTGPFTFAWALDARQAPGAFAKTGYYGTPCATSLGAAYLTSGAATATEVPIIGLKVETIEQV